MNNNRRKSRKVYIGNVAVGGKTPITVQSMTNTETTNVKQTVQQIKRLVKVGCELIRVAVPEMESAHQLSDIKKEISIPLIADIHFNFKLALEAINQGVDGLRINPGNIGKKENVIQIVKKAKKANIPIRIGINSGSIKKKYLNKYGKPTAEAMVDSALEQIEILEEQNFKDIIISLKATNIWMTIKANQLLAEKTDYPLHIGITEAGRARAGIIKSSSGIAALLTRGLGDTIRVSLTDNPVTEVEVAWEILKSLNLREKGPTVISCPTCGRTRINLIELSEKVEQALADIDQAITVAVMGCEVNGPGEAREADIGIAGGKNYSYLFKKGKLIKKVNQDKIISELCKEINDL